MSDIISQFKALKLYGMAECYAELQAQSQAGTAESIDSATWLLSQLLEAEATDRSIRTIRYQMSSAKFPIHRDLLGFDFGHIQSRPIADPYTGNAEVYRCRAEPGLSGWAPVPAKLIWPQHWVSAVFSSTANVCAFIPPLN